MNERWQKIVQIGMAAVLLLSMLILSEETAKYVATNSDQVKTIFGAKKQIEETREESGKTLVILDPGHGGIDPGKIGVNSAKEKELNLEIAKEVKVLLEQNDIDVIMTRENDNGLYQETDSNKKVQDMKNRVALIDEAGGALCVSIHQNSYQEEYVKGAQVFYYESSEEGKKIAEIMQEELVRILDSTNTRKAKANDSYYLLKNTKTPIIIAECGFLSNYEESALLIDDDYQERVAWAIHLGIIRYLNTRQK